MTEVGTKMNEVNEKVVQVLDKLISNIQSRD